MGHVAGRSIVVFCFALMVLAGCSGGSSGTSSNATPPKANVAPDAAVPSADLSDMPPYPDWAQAVVPAYPNISSRYYGTQTSFVLESKDTLDNIMAWYKSHVSGTWTEDAANGKTSTTVSGVKIDIAKDQLNTPPITMIELTKK